MSQTVIVQTKFRGVDVFLATITIEFIGLLFTIIVAILGAVNYLFSVFLKYINNMVKQKIQEKVREIEEHIQTFTKENADGVEFNKDEISLLKQAFCSQAKIDKLKRENLIHRLNILEKHIGVDPTPFDRRTDIRHTICREMEFEDDF